MKFLRVEIINCLASLGTQEAGKALSSYLAALNMDTEQTGKYDKDVVLAGVIDKIEVWDKERWNKQTDIDNIDDIAEEMAELGLSI